MPPPRQRGFHNSKPTEVKKTISRMLQYMAGFRVLWLLVFVFVVISSVASIAGTYMIRPVINNYILPLIGQKSPDLSSFARLLFRVMALFALGAFSTWCYSRLMLFISTRFLYLLRVDLFCRLEALPIKFYDTHTHGELMSRFTNDTDALREMMGGTIVHLASSSITIAGVFAMMLYLSVPLTLLVLILIVSITLLSAQIAKRGAASYRRQQNDIGALNGYIEEMVEGQKVVKAFSREEGVEKDFAVLSENLRKSGSAANIFASILGPVTNNFSHIQYAIVAIAGAALLLAGLAHPLPKILLIDLGTIAAFLQYTRSISQPISMISQQANTVLNALAGAERIFSVIDEEAEIDDGEYVLVNAWRAKAGGEERLLQSFAFTGEWAWKNTADNSLVPFKGDVVFDNVTFAYEDGKTVLHDICIHARPGQKIALVGSTGSGKTTAVNLLTRFYDVPDGSGRILFDGIPVNRIKKESLRRSLAMVQQNTHLFTGTIRENIRYGNLNASDAQVYKASALANAAPFVAQLSDGYDTVIKGDGGSLSHGQRQLLAIARAELSSAPMLVLDEATSSIDTRTEKLIEKGMDSLMRGRTTFIIAHRLSTVRNADVILVLEHGRIIESGSHEELLELKGRYYYLYTGNKI